MLMECGHLASAGQYRSLREAAKSGGRATANGLMGSKRLKLLLEAGRLRYELHTEGLLVFIDEGAYEQIVYCMPAGSPFPETSYEKPAVLDMPAAGGKGGPGFGSLEASLLSRGWVLESENLQVSMNLDDASDAAPTGILDGIELADCTEDLAEGVKRLWRGHLRPSDVPFEHWGFMTDPGQHVICATDGRGYVCGANWWACERGICEIRHTVTSPKHQRQGIGYAMLMAALQSARANGCIRAFTYINAANHRSLGLYGKAGLEPNGRRVVQFAHDRDSEV